MTEDRNKIIARILHTIYCRQDHEPDMAKLNTSEDCTFYLEETMEHTWDFKCHQDWLEQAKFFQFVAKDYGAEKALQQLASVYSIYSEMAEANINLAKFVLLIFGGNNGEES